MLQSTLYKRYIWLVELIYNAGRISREEINRRWAYSSINDERSSYIPERTFHRWRIAIEDMFGLIIECDKHNGNYYYIKNLSELENSTTYKWLLNTLAVTKLISDNKQLKDKIILEDMPSDTRFLSVLIEAIRTERVAQISYQEFNTPSPYTFDLEPYCLKVFRRRWYVFGKSSIAHDEVKKYALDRIKNIILLDTTYQIPADFDAHGYFRDYFGIERNELIHEPQRVVLELVKEHAGYFRTLPLHQTQKEIGENEDYVFFEYFLVPTFDFFQEIQSLGSAVRVIEPELFRYWLRKEAEMVADMYTE